MKALNSHFVLIDLHSSWYSAKQIPISTFGYLRGCKLTAPTFSAAFRRTRGRHGEISSSGAPVPEVRSPEIRRPRDWSNSRNGLLSVSSNVASTSSSKENEVVTDLELFLEIMPLRMRQELLRHKDIGELIEVVMDLGRKPLARFPYGDWVISEQPVKLEDLHDAVSKVV